MFCRNMHYFLVFSSEDDVDESDDDSNDDDTDDDQTFAAGKTARQTGPNGHRPIDHRPPEKLLLKAEKKVARYIERKKVS